MNPFITYPLLILLATIFIWFIYHLRKSDTANPLDLITSPDTGRLSAAKIGQLVGVVVSSWVIISAASAGRLSYELFFLYLIYTAGVDLFGKWIRAKQNMVKVKLEAAANEAESHTNRGIE